jgi:hypothetical protein
MSCHVLDDETQVQAKAADADGKYEVKAAAARTRATVCSHLACTIQILPPSIHCHRHISVIDSFLSPVYRSKNHAPNVAIMNKPSIPCR